MTHIDSRDASAHCASVDEPFRLSVIACSMDVDTDTSRPGRSCTSAPGLADQKDTDRLMNIMTDPTDSGQARPSICPSCGATADNGVKRQDEGDLATAYYRDAADHMWSVTWLEVA